MQIIAAKNSKNLYAAKNSNISKEKTTILTPKEHIKRQSMWAGKKEKVNELIHILNTDIKKFEISYEQFSPALYKMIDEIIVNAIDHAIQYPKLVKNIKINFNKKNGKITIFNDGPGIPVYIMVLVGDPLDKVFIHEFENMKLANEFCEANINKLCNKNDNIYAVKWNPQILSEHPFSGRNFKSGKEIHIRGGTNGIGMKIVNYYSKWFKIETVDLKRNLSYTQVFEDGTDIIKSPIIRDIKNLIQHDKIGNFIDNNAVSETSTGTTISFIPDYKKLGYKHDFNKLTQNDKDIIYKLIETRSYQASAYISKTNVYFQEEKIEVNSLIDLVKMYVSDFLPSNVSVTTETNVSNAEECKYIYNTVK